MPSLQAVPGGQSALVLQIVDAAAHCVAHLVSRPDEQHGEPPQSSLPSQ